MIDACDVASWLGLGTPMAAYAVTKPPMTRSTNTASPIRIRFRVKNRRQPWGASARRLGAVVRRVCAFTSLLPSVRSGPSCWVSSRGLRADRVGADSAPKYGEAAQPRTHPPFPEAEIYRVDISGVALASQDTTSS